VKVAPLKQRETSGQSLYDLGRSRRLGKNTAPSHITCISRTNFRKEVAANDRPKPIGTDDKVCLDGVAARKLDNRPTARRGHLGTLETLMIELVGERCAKLVKHRLP